MVEYKIVKYCRMCKKRFLVQKGENRLIYCDDCQKKADAERAKRNAEEAKQDTEELDD